jgi:aconitate hydratase
MIKLYSEPTYVLKNQCIHTGEENVGTTPEEARKETMTYQVLKAHNQTNDMKNLNIKFDSMGVYDNTYVGILQTAIASGLKEFPMPCVFTNCHNCLNAVGGTINEDVHKYALSACKKYGGIFVPPHEAVIHQYMREMMVNSGEMSIVSDSHTRYGSLGSLSIGEGGPELAKAMLGKSYALKYPKVVGVFMTGTPKPWVGPMDVVLSIIGQVFKNGFVKNCVLEFVGPGVKNLSMDFRNGIDTMTTESACLSSLWTTDEKTEEYFAIHGRPEGYKEMKPGQTALYDKLIEVDLDTIEPVIALPFHPSNVYSLAEVIKNPKDALAVIDANAKKTFENNPNVHWDLAGKIHDDGKLYADQSIIAGCCSGSFENIYAVGKIAEHMNKGVGSYNFNVYPASQPIMTALMEVGTLETLMNYGVRVKTAFCGPCFGAGDTPANNEFSIRHTTRNFPNREGSNPAMNQFSCVALMDSRSIAATSFNGGRLTSAADVWEDFTYPKYHFNSKIYDNTVYNGFKKPEKQTEMVYGPDIRDWPKMTELADDLLLRVASVIRDEVTTTDELIPSGETASYRSNPEKISEFTLIRKDPKYVGRAKAVREYERARLAGDKAKAMEYFNILKKAGIAVDEDRLMKHTGIGSVLYAKRPGDGSAREYAASCQKVLGGFANICIEYATKRYRSNCVNWGILPFTCADYKIQLEPGEYIYLPGIRKQVGDGVTEINAAVISPDGKTRTLKLNLPDVTEAEKEVLLAGCLINYYKLSK